MPRTKSVQNRVSFTGGLVTDANPINQDPNTVQEIKNFVIQRNGDVRRRLGIQKETDGVYNFTNVGPSLAAGDRERVAISEYFWDNPGNDPSKALGVIQTGAELWFYDVSSSAPSANLANSGNSINMATTFNEVVSGQKKVCMTDVQGYLIVVCEEFDNPHYLLYDADNDTFASGIIYLEVRDLWGVEDGLAVDERPVGLTDAHLYNLLNQGWGEIRGTETTVTTSTYRGLTRDRTDIGSLFENIASTNQVFADTGKYPSNADVESLYSSGSSNVRTNTTPAPKGRFVIRAFDRGASRIERSDLSNGDGSGIPTDSETGNIRAVKTFFNRIFYSGISGHTVDGDLRSPNYSGTVFFSQVIENDSDFGRCFQEADPTSEAFSELVATDGGFINITEANNIISLKSMGGYLLVFADNGVWAITGPEKVFKANDYIVVKITSTGAIAPDSIIEARDFIMYWSHEGIYRIQASDLGFELESVPVIQDTIQTHYNQIPSVAKDRAKGVFDAVEQRIRWLYNDLDSYDGISNSYLYNKELIYDLVLGSWYVNDFNSVQRVMGYVKTSPYVSVLSVQNVTYNGQNVTYNGDQVTYTTSERTTSTSQTKYLICSNSLYSTTNLSISLGTLSNASFLDWEGETEEVDADANLVTSWQHGGDVIRRKDVAWLHMFLRRTETGVDANAVAINPSSCLVRTRWDFSDQNLSGKWSQQRQMYRYRRFLTVTGSGDIDYGHSVIYTKDRVRGSGRVLAVEVNTAPGYDLHLHGWVVTLLGNDDE